MIFLLFFLAVWVESMWKAAKPANITLAPFKLQIKVRTCLSGHFWFRPVGSQSHYTHTHTYTHTSGVKILPLLFISVFVFIRDTLEGRASVTTGHFVFVALHPRKYCCRIRILLLVIHCYQQHTYTTMLVSLLC